MIELLSIDISNYCSKQCPFCYNHSTKEGNVKWTPTEVIDFCSDCISNGVKAISLGGGEPFEYDGVFDIIDALYSKCYLSVTTNGFPLLNEAVWQELMSHKPDKVHITIHNPDSKTEVDRVVNQVGRLKGSGIKPGVNLLVGASKIKFAHDTYQKLLTILDASQIILIPQRYGNTPTPKQLAYVADNKKFQSPACLLQCHRPQRFASVSWDKKVNSCSYAPNKEELSTLDFRGLDEALKRLQWVGGCYRL